MSLGDDILALLTSYSGGYAAMWRIIRGYEYNGVSAKVKHNVKRRTLYATIRRLKRRMFIRNAGGVFSITSVGKAYLKDRLAKNLPPHLKAWCQSSKKKHYDKFKVLVAFDIPEVDKIKRDWLRIELAAMNFLPMQKSVWIGPAPLHKDFVVNLDKIGVLDFVKFFKITDDDVI